MMDLKIPQRQLSDCQHHSTEPEAHWPELRPERMNARWPLVHQIYSMPMRCLHRRSNNGDTPHEARRSVIRRDAVDGRRHAT